MGKLQFVFVHGLSGWGSYDERYRRMPYWGMRGGDLMAALRGEGYDCYAASVVPTGSAWDRACELYAQIAGTRTDYGAAHSGRFRHERYGPDFSARPRSPHRTVPAFRAGKDFHNGIIRQGSREPCLFRIQNRFPDRGRTLKNREHFPRLFSGGTCQSGDKMV